MFMAATILAGVGAVTSIVGGIMVPDPHLSKTLELEKQKKNKKKFAKKTAKQEK